MKIFIHGLNTCGMRNVKIWSYRDFLLANGHEIVDGPADAEVVMLWTCAFRSDVRDNSLSEIARYAQEYSAEVVVAGCLPDIDRDLLNKHFQGRVVNWRDDEEKMQEIFGAPNKKLSEIPLVLSKGQLYEDEATFRKENPGAAAPYVGCYIQLYISEGCNWECTYCSERLAFPPYRSFPEEEIVKWCLREVERSGEKAVVLLGDSAGDYGSDSGSSLPALIRRLLVNVPGIGIGIQDLNPFHFLKFYDEMVEFLRAGIILHLQIPYQSASDRILEFMKRPYNHADLVRVFSALNDAGFTEIDSHIIIGFPSETEQDFEQSLQLAVDYHPKYMLVNSFMESPGIPAAKLPGKVDLETKRRRMMNAEDRFKADDEIEGLLEAHFERFNVSRREICRNFQIYTRRVFLKRFLAHYELFRMSMDLPGDIVELGVYRGASLMAWANFLEVRNMGDRAKQVIGFDNWKGFTSFDEKDGKEDPRVNKVLDGYEASVFKEILQDAIAIYDKDRFIPYKPRVILVTGDIKETVPRFVEENSGVRISLLHIDCDLYQPTKTALEFLWPRVVTGGVVIFDDYGIRPWEGESTAADE